MAKGLLEWCKLPGGSSKLEKCHVFAAVDKSYTIAQTSAHLQNLYKQKVNGSNPDDAALFAGCGLRCAKARLVTSQQIPLS